MELYRLNDAALNTLHHWLDTLRDDWLRTEGSPHKAMAIGALGLAVKMGVIEQEEYCSYERWVNGWGLNSTGSSQLVLDWTE